MVKTGDPNPHDFIYPSFYYYSDTLGYWLYYWAGHVSGVFNRLADLTEPILLHRRLRQNVGCQALFLMRSRRVRCPGACHRRLDV